MMAMSDVAVLNAGDRLALQCAVIKGALPITVNWLKDSAPAASVAGVHVKLINDFTASLSVESLSAHHAGLYTCAAHNHAGPATSTVTLIVQGHYANLCSFFFFFVMHQTEIRPNTRRTEISRQFYANLCKFCDSLDGNSSKYSTNGNFSSTFFTYYANFVIHQTEIRPNTRQMEISRQLHQSLCKFMQIF